MPSLQVKLYLRCVCVGKNVCIQFGTIYSFSQPLGSCNIFPRDKDKFPRDKDKGEGAIEEAIPNTVAEQSGERKQAEERCSAVAMVLGFHASFYRDKSEVSKARASSTRFLVWNEPWFSDLE